LLALQNDTAALKRIREVAGSKIFASLVEAWKQASGGNGGVNYCNVLLHTAQPGSI
jgi:hypothetical protein